MGKDLENTCHKINIIWYCDFMQNCDRSRYVNNINSELSMVAYINNTIKLDKLSQSRTPCSK